MKCKLFLLMAVFIPKERNSFGFCFRFSLHFEEIKAQIVDTERGFSIDRLGMKVFACFESFLFSNQISKHSHLMIIVFVTGIKCKGWKN